MSYSVEQIQVLYEIAMSIGDGGDMRVTLKSSLSTILGKLNCSAGVVYEKREVNGGARFEHLYSIPRSVRNVARFKPVLDRFARPFDEKELSGLMESCPADIEVGPDFRSYIFDLPGFGLIVLFKNGQPLGPMIVESLVSVCGKLADACRACVANEKLVASLSQLHATLESTGDGILVIDGERMVEQYSKRFREMWSLPEDFATGCEHKQLLALMAPRLEDPEEFLSATERIYSGASGANYDVVKFSDGRVCERRIYPRSLMGEERGWVTIYQDVTQKLRSEEQIRRAQRIKAIGVLAGGIAHDFNNILTGIIGYIEVAMDPMPPDSDGHGYLGESLKACRKAKDLTQQILMFGRRVKIDFQPVRLHDVIEDTLKLLTPSFSTDIDIRKEIADEDDVIMADATQLTQVIMNLCSNAEYAMKQTGGVLSIKVEPFEVNNEFAGRHEKLATGQYVKLSIGDTGAGIASETMEQIFEPFFTTKPRGRGTGMGLSVVHGIVESHKGVISVHSKVGQGTGFTLLFPKANA